MIPALILCACITAQLSLVNGAQAKGHCGSSPTCYHKPHAHHRAVHAHRDTHGRIARSHAAKDAFMRKHPCPSTGRTHGSCPGYIIDHVKALCVGGKDAPSNMQWQTVADAKAKDKIECKK